MSDESTTVLIADDDDDIRSVVSSAVSSLGYFVLEVSDGQKAVTVCKESLPDLAILDIMMPGMNGTEVCRWIKQSEGGNLVPVIMLTGRDSVQDKVDALDKGADDYLTKPFHYQELQARIKALLRVRELNLRLQEKNAELSRMQAKIIEQERQLVVNELAGTAAHQLGQPLSAIMLNCHLIETLPQTDQKFVSALAAIKQDARRMATMIEKLKSVDATKKEGYYGRTEIFDIDAKKK